MNLVLLGPPGAGKGTQAVKLCQGLRLNHISTGEMLREEMKKDSELGRQAKVYVQSGELVPDALVTRMIEKKIFENSLSAGFVLDGFPRNETQAESLDAMLKVHNAKIDAVVYLEASLVVILPRLTGRRVCKNCGANFHIQNMPPKKEGVCDHCSGEIYQRSDDKEETITNRLKVYNQSTAKVVNYYQRQGILKKVNADRDAREVYDYLVAALAAGSGSGF